MCKDVAVCLPETSKPIAEVIETVMGTAKEGPYGYTASHSVFREGTIAVGTTYSQLLANIKQTWVVLIIVSGILSSSGMRGSRIQEP